MEKEKVFLDSNILFSIVYTKNSPESRFSLFLDLHSKNYFDLFISHYVKNEVRRNVEKKIPSSLKNLEKILENFNILKDDSDIINEIKIFGLPVADSIILNTAINNKIDFFITGNTKDFKELYGTRINKCLIVQPKDFFEYYA
jgi:predicted nucleic acid-binding protein